MAGPSRIHQPSDDSNVCEYEQSDTQCVNLCQSVPFVIVFCNARHKNQMPRISQKSRKQIFVFEMTSQNKKKQESPEKPEE